MCCEICPRYTTCEEEGHLSDLCCVSCADYKSCLGDEKDIDESTDESESI